MSPVPLTATPGPARGAPADPSDPAVPPVNAALSDKHAALRRILEDIPSLIVAYSGGVDSAFLAFEATAVLGSRALCVTADSASYPDRHRQIALSLAASHGFRHEIIRTGELERPATLEIPSNPGGAEGKKGQGHARSFVK